MTRFTVKQEEITRLKVFADHVGKLKGVAPISSKQLFCVDTQLEVVSVGEGGSSGAVQGEIKLDIENVSFDDQVKKYFVTELETVLLFLSKISSDAQFSYTDDQLTITGEGKSKFTTRLLIGYNDEEVKEIQSFITTQLALPEFEDANKITLDLSNIKEELLTLAPLTKEFELNKMIEISSTHLKVADNFGIFSHAITTKPTLQTIYFHRDIAQLIKNSDKITISSDKKFWYFDIVQFGIKILFVAPTAQWQYPTDDELAGFLPEKTKRVKLEINAKKFYEVLDEFDGMFSQWTYGQIVIKTPANFDSEKKLEVSWDDKLHLVETTLPVNIIERTDTDEVDFVIPTKELKAIKSLFYKDDNSVMYLEYSTLPSTEEHGAGINIYNDQGVEIGTPKMNGSSL
jgi:hypothetical protein